MVGVEVIAGLRTWASGTPTTEAAVDLLIQMDLVRLRWVHSADMDRLHRLDVSTLVADLAAASTLSSSERKVLAIVASLAGGQPADFSLAGVLRGLGRTHLELILAAIAHAGGQVDDPLRCTTDER